MVLINPSAPDRVFYTHLFARLVRDRRRKLGLTVNRAAELAGITSSQWVSIEAGWVPQDHQIVRTIAAALEIRATELQVASIMSFLAQEETAVQ
jgi:predicted transcriptional regulator